MFVVWDHEFDMVTGDLTITAQYARESGMKAFSLFTKDQLKGLAAYPTISKGNEGCFVLSLDLLRSTDLETFTPWILTDEDETVSIDPEGGLELRFKDPDDTAFFQFQFVD